MKRQQIFWLMLLAGTWLLATCHQPAPLWEANARLLGYSIVSPPQNPLTPEGVALGAKLFFEPLLSGNDRISCATCHQPARAFTDGQALSTLGISGKPLARHVPTLFNLAWADSGLFWDGGAKNLESLSVAPLTHPDEMGQELKALPAELEAAGYRPLFQKAFGADTITTAAILRALAQFQRTLISANTRYDRWQKQEPGAVLSAVEQQGLRLFERDCASCHRPPLFTDHRFHNNGLDSIFSDEGEGMGLGRYRISNREEDVGRFKTPTLRNIGLTAPYMHDGRFQTLEQVIDHYTGPLAHSPTLAPALRQNTALLRYQEAERQALLAFLLTLTD